MSDEAELVAASRVATELARITTRFWMDAYSRQEKTPVLSDVDAASLLSHLPGVATKVDELRGHLSRSVREVFSAVNDYPATLDKMAGESYVALVLQWAEECLWIATGEAWEGCWTSLSVSNLKRAEVDIAAANFRRSAVPYLKLKPQLEKELIRVLKAGNHAHITAIESSAELQAASRLDELMRHHDELVRSLAEAYSELRKTGDTWFTLRDLADKAGYSYDSLRTKSSEYQQEVVFPPETDPFRVRESRTGRSPVLGGSFDEANQAYDGAGHREAA